MRALDRALVCTIITLLNDSERLLNSAFVIRKSDASICWKAKRITILRAILIVSFHISTQKTIDILKIASENITLIVPHENLLLIW